MGSSSSEHACARRAANDASAVQRCIMARCATATHHGALWRITTPLWLEMGGGGEALKYFRAASVEVGVKTWGVGVGLEISGLSWETEVMFHFKRVAVRS